MTFFVFKLSILGLLFGFLCYTLLYSALSWHLFIELGVGSITFLFYIASHWSILFPFIPFYLFLSSAFVLCIAIYLVGYAVAALLNLSSKAFGSGKFQRRI